jgi:dihydroneopterin aldolase
LIPDSAGDDTIVTLKGMQFKSLVGILDEEKTVAQPIEVDLSLRVERPRGEISVHNILDYRHAYNLVGEILNAGHIPYLEEAAERIAERSLALPLVKSVTVAIRKPRVSLGGPLAYAEIRIERRRN